MKNSDNFTRVKRAERLRRFAAVLLILATVVCLGGCTSTKVEYDEDYADETVTTWVEWMLAMDKETLESMLDYPTMALDDDQLIQYNGLQTYYDILDEIGEYAGSYGDFVYKDSADEVVVNVTAEGTLRSFTIELIFDVEKGTFFLSSISCTADYTMSEKLVAAAQNTLIGVVIVFIVLILILIILSQLQRIDRAIDSVMRWSAKRKADKARKKAGIVAPDTGVSEEIPDTSAASDEPASSDTAAEVAETDDLELVAVIAAAIAASEGVSPDGFVVRSIRRSDKWKRGR